MMLAAAPVPSVFNGTAEVLAMVVLLATFAMFRTQLLRAQVKLYAVQSLFVSGLALAAAVTRGESELYVLAVVSAAVKVVAIPAVMRRLLDRIDGSLAGHEAFSVTTAVLVGIAVAAFGFFAVGALEVRTALLPRAALAIGVAVILESFLLMIARTDVPSQAIGFFSLENGVSIAGLVVATGMPLLLELLFLFDLLVAVVAFGVMMRTLHLRSATVSARGLERLRG